MKKYFLITILGLLLAGTASAGFWSDFFRTEPVKPILSGTTLAVPYGGTGASTFTSGQCLIGNGTGAITTAACGSASSGGALGWSYSAESTLLTRSTTTEQTLIGGSATTSSAIFEVIGTSEMDNVNMRQASSTFLYISDSLTIGAYQFPNTDGNASDVLTTDGSGVLSWNAQSGSGGGAAWEYNAAADAMVTTSTKGIMLTASSSITTLKVDDLRATSSLDYWLTIQDTGDLTEGTNLYYTDNRVRDYINASTTIQTHFNYADTAYGWGDHSIAGYYAAADFATDWASTYNATSTLNGFSPSDYLPLTGGTLTGGATTTNFAITGLGGGGGDLKIAADGSFYEGTDASGTGLQSWQATTTAGFLANTLTPTSTAASLVWNGNATTTGDFIMSKNAAASGNYCLQIDDLGKVTNTGAACGEGSSGTLQHKEFEATAGQTVFDLAFTYTKGDDSLVVFVNGLRMRITDDYAETDSDTITFVSGRNLGDKVTVNVFGGAGTGLTNLNSETLGSIGDVSTTTLAYGSQLIWDTSNWVSSSTMPYLEVEWDKLYNATSTLSGFTNNQTNWNTAYGWGDHASGGYYVTANDSYVLNTTDTMTGGLTMNSATTTDTMYISSLGTAAGTFLAADATGKVIATTTPSVGSVDESANYAWTGNHTFTNASTTGFAITDLGTAAGSFLAVNANGTVIATTTPTGGSGVALGDSPSWTGQHDWKYAGVPVNFQNTTDAISNQVAIFSAGNRATPADNDQGYLSFYGDDDLGNQVEFSRILWEMDDVVNTSKDSTLRFYTMSGNSLYQTLYLDYSNGSNFYVASGKKLGVEGGLEISKYGYIEGNADKGIFISFKGSTLIKGKMAIDDADSVIGTGYPAGGLVVAPRWSEAASGNHPLIAGIAIKPTIIDVGAATVSDTASLYIEGSAASTTVSGVNYGLWVDNTNGETVSRIDGKLMIGATTTAPFELTVQGSALADDWFTYSPMSDKLNASAEIKKIKCEKGTSKDGWCDIDHASLPAGVRVQKDYKKTEIIGYEHRIDDVWDEELQATTTVEWDKAITEEQTITGDYMSMTKMMAVLVQSNQELIARVEVLEAVKVGGIDNNLEARITELENKINWFEKFINWIQKL